MIAHDVAANRYNVNHTDTRAPSREPVLTVCTGCRLQHSFVIQSMAPDTDAEQRRAQALAAAELALALEGDVISRLIPPEEYPDFRDFLVAAYESDGDHFEQFVKLPVEAQIASFRATRQVLLRIRAARTVAAQPATAAPVNPIVAPDVLVAVGEQIPGPNPTGVSISAVDSTRVDPVDVAGTSSTLIQMQNAVATLAQLMAAQTSNAAPIVAQGPRLQHPEKFDGSDRRKTKAFLAQVDLYLQLNAASYTTEASKAGFLLFQLAGEAKKWATPIMLDAARPEYADYQLLRAAIEDAFGEKNARARAVKELKALKQMAGESVHDFDARFLLLQAEIGAGYGDLAYKDAYEDALKEEVKDLLMTYPVAETLEGLRANAKRVQDRIDQDKRRIKVASAPSSSRNAGKPIAQDSGTSTAGSGGTRPFSAPIYEFEKDPVPMDLDHIRLTHRFPKRDKLPQWVKDKIDSEKRCRLCIMVGHKANECPKKKAVNAAVASVEVVGSGSSAANEEQSGF